MRCHLTIFPDGPCKVGRRLLKQRDDIFVEWIHVLEQPLITDVVHTTGVVKHTEVGLLAEVRFLELWMSCVLRKQLLHQSFISRLRKPTFLVNYCQETDRLRKQYTIITGHFHSSPACLLLFPINSWISHSPQFFLFLSVIPQKYLRISDAGFFTSQMSFILPILTN